MARDLDKLGTGVNSLDGSLKYKESDNSPKLSELNFNPVNGLRSPSELSILRLSMLKSM